MRTLVQLGRSLEIATLAEGIEDEAQLHALQSLHCDRGQGYLFSRPVEPEAIEALLAGTPAAPGGHAAEPWFRARSFPVREHVEDPMARL